MRRAQTRRRSRGCWWITFGIRKAPWTPHFSALRTNYISSLKLSAGGGICPVVAGQECFFSAWFCYRGPWRPPKASVMLSGKSSKMSFSSWLGVLMNSTNCIHCKKNSLAYIGDVICYCIYLYIYLSIWTCVYLYAESGFCHGVRRCDTPAMCYCLH